MSHFEFWQPHANSIGLFAREAHVVSISTPRLLWLKEEQPSIEASSHLELKAVYSRSLETARKVTPDQPLDRYADDADQGLPQLLARPDIQGVIIAYVLESSLRRAP